VDYVSGGFCPPQSFRRFYLNFQRLFEFQIFRLNLPAVLKPSQMPLFGIFSRFFRKIH
jgi:hypothetical protein